MKKGGVSVGTLHTLVSNERKRRVEESFIEFNDGKAKKEKKVKKAVIHQPRTRQPFNEKDWEEAYKQACEDLTPEELEACGYITPTASLSTDLLTPDQFDKLTLSK